MSKFAAPTLNENMIIINELKEEMTSTFFLFFLNQKLMALVKLGRVADENK
jgi:hypothetical protein